VVYETGTHGVQVATPLLADDRVLGAIAFRFPVGRRFGGDEIELMRTLGRQAGQALERLQLQEESDRRAWQSTFLARLSRGLDEAVASDSRARRLVALLVPELAEYAQVDMTTPDGPDAQQITSAYDSTTGVIVSGTTTLWRLPEEVRIALKAMGRRDSAAVVPFSAPGGRRGIVLPLYARSTVIGTLILAGAPAVPGGRDRDFLVDVAGRCGLALDNARLAEQDREIAHALQRSLLTNDGPTDARYRAATVYRPAVRTLEIGGKIGVVVGDVVGRGVAAATAMGQLRSAVRALAKSHSGPAAVLRHLDEFVATLETGRLTTLAYAELSLDTGILNYACAGHPPPLLIAPDRTPRFLWEGRSGPLGSVSSSRVRAEAEHNVPRGSRLLLYTDGLVERRGESLQLGLDRLAETVNGYRHAPLESLAEDLADTMLAGSGGHDDMCLLALDYTDTPRFSSEFAARMANLAELRNGLSGWLLDHGIGEYDRFGIVLACSEAVANAIKHGCHESPTEQVSVLASLDSESCELRVSDTGQWRTPRTSSDRGRGLYLMGQLMDELIVDRGAGTTVLMRRKIGRSR
jgi:serine/threonine-protein kinase RsbW